MATTKLKDNQVNLAGTQINVGDTAPIADGALAGVTCRAIYVIDAKGVVTFKEISPEITEEPDYDAILAAIK
jgi:peroxiredoxin